MSLLLKRVTCIPIRQPAGMYSDNLTILQRNVREATIELPAWKICLAVIASYPDALLLFKSEIALQTSSHEKG